MRVTYKPGTLTRSKTVRLDSGSTVIPLKYVTSSVDSHQSTSRLQSNHAP